MLQVSAVIALVCLVFPIEAGVQWTVPPQTRAPAGNVFPCSNPPQEPLYDFWTDQTYNLTFNILNNVPSSYTNLTFIIYRWLPDGNLTSVTPLFTCICDYYQNRTAPEPGIHVLPEYKFLSSQRCNYDVERCAIVIDMWRPDGSHTASCADVVVLTHNTDQKIQLTVTPPAGTSPPAVDTFLDRLFTNYGTAGTKIALGLSNNNVQISQTPFRVRGDGSYIVTFTISDYLDVSVAGNGQRTFRGYYSATRAAQVLVAEPLDGTGLGAVTPGVSIITATQVANGDTSSNKPPPEDNSPGVIIGIVALVIFGGLLVVFVVARLFFPETYAKMIAPCPKK